MKNIGVWLDKEKAHIVTIENKQETFETIYSEIENYKVTANRFIGGSKEIVKDKTYLEREKNQLKKYFKNIAFQIKEADLIVIFGPSKTYKKFNKELQEVYKDIGVKVKSVQKTDSMTDNQLKALLRGFLKVNELQ